jgi:hypothetical protein
MTMARRHTSARAWIVASLLASGGSLIVGCDSHKLSGEESEIKPHNTKLNLPEVPPFDLPKPYDADTHSVKEMRIEGKQYFGKDGMKLHGFITYVYDCATEIKQPGQSDADVKKIMDADPTKCRRPAFYIGDEKTTTPDHSVHVVEIPRAPRADEMKNISKDQKAWQERYDKGVIVSIDGFVVPPYKVGDEVIVTGSWKQTSPHGEADSDGLLIYKTMTNKDQSWTEPSPKANAGPGPLDTPASGATDGGATAGGPAPATKKKPGSH